ncbi:multiheme c-type cytochrome [Thermodesulfobacteriota bacterium]
MQTNFRKLIINTVIAALIILSFAMNVALASDDHDHDEHHDEEKRPFYPSQMQVKGNRQIKSSDFTDPEECGECHTEIYEQWNGSMHSKAMVDPIFLALWEIGNKETNGLTMKLCSGCHSAIGVSTLEINDMGYADLSEIAKKGVQCDVCHSISGTNFMSTDPQEPHNATFILDPGSVKRGPFKDSKSDFHETEYSEMHTKSDFCGNCHHVYHPLSNFPIERTFDEWKYSVYAQNDIHCQDCHMVPVEIMFKNAATLKKHNNPGKAVDDGPDREHIYTHEFVGGNFTITAMLGSEKHANIAKQRLKGAATVEIMPAGIKKGFGSVKVKVTNVAAGHNLPTSLTEVRQMWLDITVTDKDSGKEIFSTGKLDKKGNIEPDSVIFNAYAVDKDGHHTYKPWEIVRFDYNKTIPPKGSALEKFSFAVPEGVKNVNVAVKLRYRSYPQALADLLLKDKTVTLPVVDMVVTDSDFKVEG